jgi:TraB/PrgY/gumN family
MRQLQLVSTIMTVLLLSTNALAQEQAAPAAPVATSDIAASEQKTADPPADPNVLELQALVVTGAQPGPGLWKVSKGENVMWVLGTQSPLPNKMEWESNEVEKTIAASQEVLRETSVTVGSDIGVFRGMMLLPSLYSARKNPDDKHLKDVVPAPLYARWLVLKQKYIGNDSGIEKWRPIFASQELYTKAVEKSGLTFKNSARSRVMDLAKKNKVPVITPKIDLKFEEPKAAIKEFKKTSLSDIECFEKTITRLETDLGAMIDRANAWSVGDIEGLKNLPYADQNVACANALTSTTVAKKKGLSDIREQSMQVWLKAAETALNKNKMTFAVIPMTEIMRPTGYLAKLKEKGYSIEAP